jgi:transmembrane sensor
MDELAKELASARGALVPAWSEARAERLLVGVSQLRRKRRAQRVVATGLASLAAVGLLYFGGSLSGIAGRNPMSASTRTVPVGQSATGLKEPGMRPALDHALPLAQPEIQVEDKLAALPLKLADGSRVKALSSGAAVAVEGNEPKQIRLRLDAGGARFDVIPNKHREFTVRAGSVEVAVLGTVFDVERADGRVHVSVSRGKVRVRTGVTANGSIATAIVKAGESQWFDDPAPSERGLANMPNAASVTSVERTRQLQAAERSAGLTPSAAKARRHSARERAHEQDEDAPRAEWRSLSQSGDYEGAYQLLQQSTVSDDDSGALLDAADAARLSGHPQVAVTYLRKVLDQHRESPVAPLAAFTLGRVLLERLGQPSEAADAFSVARQLAPTGSLAQDALAREVEAWSKAGRPDDAYRAARQYVDVYPKGRRLRAVQLYGGL